jgi:hypothetical protein
MCQDGFFAAVEVRQQLAQAAVVDRARARGGQTAQTHGTPMSVETFTQGREFVDFRIAKAPYIIAFKHDAIDEMPLGKLPDALSESPPAAGDLRHRIETDKEPTRSALDGVDPPVRDVDHGRYSFARPRIESPNY